MVGQAIALFLERQSDVQRLAGQLALGGFSLGRVKTSKFVFFPTKQHVHVLDLFTWIEYSTELLIAASMKFGCCSNISEI